MVLIHQRHEFPLINAVEAYAVCQGILFLFSWLVSDLLAD